jgi:hypothetical protein
MAGTCRNKVLSDQVTAQIRLAREGLVRTAELLQQSARVVQRFKALSGRADAGAASPNVVSCRTFGPPSNCLPSDLP